MKQPTQRTLKIAVFASALAIALPGVSLADYTARNSNTGNDSSNSASVTDTTTYTYSGSNTSNVTNTIDADINTGDNEANGNTGDGTVHSGDAALDAAITTEANTNTGISQLFSNDSGSGTVQNTNTGNGSNNDAEATFSRIHNITQTNVVTADNNVDITMNTGGNRANGNTGDGTVTSGDILARIRINTLANTRTNPPINPIPTPGGGGGGETIAPPTTSNGGGTITIPNLTEVLTGQGGGSFIETVMPREGIGGGFFPAGSNWLFGYLLMALGIGLILFSDKLRQLTPERFFPQEPIA